MIEYDVLQYAMISYNHDLIFNVIFNMMYICVICYDMI